MTSFIVQKINGLNSTVPIECFTWKALLLETPFGSSEEYLKVVNFFQESKNIRVAILTALMEKAGSTDDPQDFKALNPEMFMHFYPHATAIQGGFIPVGDLEPANCVIYTRLKCDLETWQQISQTQTMIDFIAARNEAAPILGWEFSEYKLVDAEELETYADVAAAWEAAASL